MNRHMEQGYACVLLMLLGINRCSMSRDTSSVWSPRRTENPSMEMFQFSLPTKHAGRVPRPFLMGHGALRPQRRVHPIILPGQRSWSFPQPAVAKSSRIKAFPFQPNVEVVIDTGSPLRPNDKVSVALSPDMSVMDALQQAEGRYVATPGDDLDNPFSVNLRQSSFGSHRCLTFGSVGGIMSGRAFHWKITVLDSRRKVIYSGTCIPGRHAVKIRPGYRVILNFVPVKTSLYRSARPGRK